VKRKKWSGVKRRREIVVETIGQIMNDVYEEIALECRYLDCTHSFFFTSPKCHQKTSPNRSSYAQVMHVLKILVPPMFALSMTEYDKYTYKVSIIQVRLCTWSMQSIIYNISKNM